MANFGDLAAELILAVTSYIPRSSDKFHLVLVNRKMHQMITPEPYKHILLGQSR